MKAQMVKALALAIAFIMFIQPATAFTAMSVPFVTTDSCIFVEPLQFADLTITEFNQTHYTEGHMGHLDISSPVLGGGRVSDQVIPDRGDSLSPLLPSMTQNIEDNFTYNRTYIFIDVFGAV